MSDCPPESKPLSVREGYDRWSAVYDHEDNPLVALEEQLVREWVGDASGLRIADIGCGTGRHTLWLARAGAEVDGFDCSGGMLERARHKLSRLKVRLHPHQLPAAIPADDDTFDLIIFALVADHVADLQAVFGDLLRTTKPTGRLIFTVMHPAMNLKGVSARFAESQDGPKVYVDSCTHTCSDYVLAILRSGWDIADMIELAANDQLAARSPRADKYVGWPMLLAMQLRKAGRRSSRQVVEE